MMLPKNMEIRNSHVGEKDILFISRGTTCSGVVKTKSILSTDSMADEEYLSAKSGIITRYSESGVWKMVGEKGCH